MQSNPPSVRLLLHQPTAPEGDGILLRSRLQAVGRRMGFDEVLRERCVLVAAEMLSNQIKYAGGRGFIQIWQTGPHSLDLFALDHGPGIDNLAWALQDGMSSKGTLGKGLGSIQRLASCTDFFSLTAAQAPQGPWQGTAVWARFCPEAGSRRAGAVDTGMHLRAYGDARENGDGIWLEQQGPVYRWLHMDALGHGPEADAVRQRVFDHLDLSLPFERVFEALDRLLTGQRGAVLMLSEVDTRQHVLQFAGVGDMSAQVLCGGTARRLELAEGVVGHLHRQLRIERVDCPLGGAVITASDGLRGGWTASLPGLTRLRAPMQALLLGNIFGRLNDDQSVFVIRW